jgi:5-hydroxyisourate hydrolase
VLDLRTRESQMDTEHKTPDIDQRGACAQLVHRRHMFIIASSFFAAIAFAGATVRAAPPPGLTTHVLDVTTGKPAEGVQIDFFVAEGETYRLVRSVVTNADGRVAEPLLTADTIKVGQYQLVFHIADYFSKLGTVLPKPPFLDKAVVQFGISDATSHYHVPLLASPWSYTTYRGS